jgi:hypothetical protein
LLWFPPFSVYEVIATMEWSSEGAVEAQWKWHVEEEHVSTLQVCSSEAYGHSAAVRVPRYASGVAPAAHLDAALELRAVAAYL